MKDKSYFEHALNEYYKKIIRNFLLKQSQILLASLASIYALIFVVSRFVVIVEWKALLVVASILVCAFLIYDTVKKYPKHKSAVKWYNNYIENDFVVTTYELPKTHNKYKQMKDMAEQKMKSAHASIMKEKLPFILWKNILTVVIASILISLNFIFPSETQQTAEKIEIMEQLTEETKKEVEKLKELTKDEKKHELINTTLEEMTELQELEDLIQKLEELHSKLNLQFLKEFEQMREINDLVQSKNSELASLQKALAEKQFDKLKEALDKIDSTNLSEKEKQAMNSIENLTKDQLEALLNGEWDEELAKQLTNIGKTTEQQIRQIDPSTLAKYNGQIVHPTNNTTAANNSTNQNSNQNNNPSNNNSNSNNGNNPSQNPGNSPGNQQGQSGSTVGIGGSSNQPGAIPGASGVGVGQGSRELTFPSRIISEELIEMDNGALGEGKEGSVFESSGLAVKGSIRNYEEIVNSYEGVNQEAINRTPLPTNIAELVREYFSNLE